MNRPDNYICIQNKLWELIEHRYVHLEKIIQTHRINICAQRYELGMKYLNTQNKLYEIMEQLLQSICTRRTNTYTMWINNSYNLRKNLNE